MKASTKGGALEGLRVLWNWCCEHPLGAALAAMALMVPEALYGLYM